MRAELSTVIDSYDERLTKKGSLTEEDRKEHPSGWPGAGEIVKKSAPSPVIFPDEGEHYVYTYQ